MSSINREIKNQHLLHSEQVVIQNTYMNKSKAIKIPFKKAVLVKAWAILLNGDIMFGEIKEKRREIKQADNKMFKVVPIRIYY